LLLGRRVVTAPRPARSTLFPYTTLFRSSGVIKGSDGEFVTLRIKAEDALGRKWYEKEYEMQTGITSYSESRDRTQDPYQKVFNEDRKSTRLNSSHVKISYAVFCLKKKKR